MCRLRTLQLGVRAVVVLFLLGVPWEGYAGELPLPSVTISGRIVTIDGRPVAGKVSIRSARGNTYNSAADADGAFRLGVNPQEVLRMYGLLMSGGLIVKGQDLAPALVSLPVVPAGGQVSLGDIVLPPGTGIAGQVVSPEGTPVAGAQITARASALFLGRTGNNIVSAITLATDETGGFEIPPLPCCHFSLKVRAEGFQSVVVAQQLDGRSRRIELQLIRMRREFPVQGQVRDAEGQPIPGARVLFHGGEQRTDADGHFRLHGLGPHYDIQLIARAAGYHPYSEKHQGERTINIVLSRTHDLTGRVIDARTEKPIKLTQVVLCTYSLDANGEPLLGVCRSLRARQPEPGKFMVEHWGPDRYHLVLKAKGYHDRELYLDPLDSNRDWDLGDIRLQPQDQPDKQPLVVQRLRGTVTRGGKPLAGATVSLWHPRKPFEGRENSPVHYGRLVPPSPSFGGMKISGEQGAFELSVPRQADWLVRVDVPQAAPTVVGPVSVQRGEDTRQDIEVVEGGRLVGRVKKAECFAPGVLWAVVFDGRGIMEAAQVDQTGQFRVDRLPVGTYGVKVGHFGIRDPEIYGGEWETVADPWQRAEKVEVVAGKAATVEAWAPFY